MSSFLRLWDIFRFSYFTIFIATHTALMLGIFLEWLREKRTLQNADEEAPLVSVIIPVRNESGRMKGLLKSLAAQDYSPAEIIFIDDRSTDDSAKMIAAFIRESGRGNARIISLGENPGPNYKQFALARGIEAASGVFLLFTDADCELPPLWIRGMVKRMSGGKTGAAIGPVFKRPGGKGFFHLYQCFEHGIRYVYLAGATGLGAAGGGFGNNLILRRACLDVVGGYEKVPVSPTEDAALISRIRSCSAYKIRAVLGRDVHVITQGEDTWKKLVNQTLRWNNGGLFGPDTITRINYNFLMIIIGVGILALPFVPFFPSAWPLPAAVILAMIFNSAANIGLFGVSLPRNSLACGLNLFFTPMFLTFLTVLGYLGIRSDWKGKKV